MSFLSQQNRRSAGEEIVAQGKNVVVLGGGDTGSDCVGTAIRQGARSVTQIELLPKPPDNRSVNNPWPAWPNIMRTSSSHEEGCNRLWSILTKDFVGADGIVKELRCVRLDWREPDETRQCSFSEVPETEFKVGADLVLLAMGFVHVEHGHLVRDLGLETKDDENLKVGPDYMTSSPGVFAAGDAVSGASLVVTAIYLGRKVAEAIDHYLSSSR